MTTFPAISMHFNATLTPSKATGETYEKAHSSSLLHPRGRVPGAVAEPLSASQGKKAHCTMAECAASARASKSDTWWDAVPAAYDAKRFSGVLSLSPTAPKCSTVELAAEDEEAAVVAVVVEVAVAAEVAVAGDDADMALSRVVSGRGEISMGETLDDAAADDDAVEDDG